MSRGDAVGSHGLEEACESLPHGGYAAIFTEAALGELGEGVELCAPHHELLDGGAQLLLGAGGVPAGLLVGQRANYTLPDWEALLVLLWERFGAICLVLLAKQCCQRQVLGFRIRVLRGDKGKESTQLPRAGVTLRVTIFSQQNSMKS